MRVIIEIEVYDECADPDHEIGLTEEAYNDLFGLALPGDIYDVRKAED